MNCDGASQLMTLLLIIGVMLTPCGKSYRHSRGAIFDCPVSPSMSGNNLSLLACQLAERLLIIRFPMQTHHEP